MSIANATVQLSVSGGKSAASRCAEGSRAGCRMRVSPGEAHMHDLVMTAVRTVTQNLGIKVRRLASVVLLLVGGAPLLAQDYTRDSGPPLFSYQELVQLESPEGCRRACDQAPYRHDHSLRQQRGLFSRRAAASSRRGGAWSDAPRRVLEHRAGPRARRDAAVSDRQGTLHGKGRRGAQPRPGDRSSGSETSIWRRFPRRSNC